MFVAPPAALICGVLGMVFDKQKMLAVVAAFLGAGLGLFFYVQHYSIW